MALASSSSSSSCVHNQHQRKYDVFLSFRGKDTRDNFISHLHAALSEKGLETFIDYQLRKGDEIAPALLQAIEESMVAVVVFSKDYASSSWCLDELVKIMECRETHGLIVTPVFYNVNPSDVRKQIGTFTFDRKRKRNSQINSDKFPKWKAALTGAANLSGWDSNVIRLEHKLIDQIVKDVLEKLNQVQPLSTSLERLVGTNSRLEQIKRILAIGSQDTRILGIWGMGGIGKTTIAEAIFYQISHQFESCCFLKNVREESERSGMNKLLEELISQALGDNNIKIYTPSIGPGLSFIRRLCRRQILAVLDDVDDSQQFECLVGNPCWFGLGSRIIVTSRNKQAFESRTDYIYEVKALCDYAALQLFSQYAFKQNHPIEDHKPLSDLVVRYCQGNPLALKVMGSLLFGKNDIEWESTINKLKKVPISKIQEVLKISYKGLDREEREIFLHIACFFKGENRDVVIRILNICGFSAEIGIRDLIDKSLISTTTTIIGRIEVVVLDMHDLSQEMGREIVRGESKEPGERSRLWDSQDIYQVFMKDTGTRKVEGMFLNVHKLTKEIHLNPKAFENMSSLKFLKVYNLEDVEGLEEEECKVHLSQGLDYLPNELIYLYWQGYPLEYLPTGFCPENPLLIELPHSNIKGLWKEAEFESTAKHFSSLSQFRMVTCLRLENCNNLTSLPNNVDMGCLDILDLSGCERFEIFPEVSRNIKYLYLRMTAIKEVPSSIENLDQLVELSLGSCFQLESLPTNIGKLTNLKFLSLRYCCKLKLFPKISERMVNLAGLDLSWTAIEELPSSMENLKGLNSLSMDNCRILASLTSWLGISFVTLCWLRFLSLRYCELWQLPANLGCLSALKGLSLSGNNFESIPESVKQLTELQTLCIDKCERLQSLPELPGSLLELDASDCTSLENISSLYQLFSDGRSHDRRVNFSRCFKLHTNARDHISRLGIHFSVKQWMRPSIFVCYPEVRLPEWCGNQSTGDTVRVPLPSNWLNNDGYLGFIICLFVECHHLFDIELQCNCHFGDNCDDGGDFTFVLHQKRWLTKLRSRTEQVVMLFACSLYDIIPDICPRLTQFSCDAVLFKFKPIKASVFPQSYWEVKKCGAIPLHAKNESTIHLSLPLPLSKIHAHPPSSQSQPSSRNAHLRQLLSVAVPKTWTPKKTPSVALPP